MKADWPWGWAGGLAGVPGVLQIVLKLGSNPGKVDLVVENFVEAIEIQIGHFLLLATHGMTHGRDPGKLGEKD